MRQHTDQLLPRRQQISQQACRFRARAVMRRVIALQHERHRLDLQAVHHGHFNIQPHYIRVKLFDPPEEEWPEIIPLFEPDFFVYYDRYGDGDPFEDPDYIRHFRTVRQGLITGRKLDIEFQGLSHLRRKILIPDRLEYSPKDDKFRLLGHTESPRNYIVNIGRIRNVELLGPVTEEDPAAPEPEKRELVMVLKDERNALERAMLHFSDLEKETVRTGEDTYRIRLVYRRDDEPEILIRILSFGPMLKVVEPESFVRQIRERLNRQN